jgi:hypothetical protein
MNEITQVLEQEIKLNKKETWNKLDKTIKLKKLSEYASLYCKKNNLNDNFYNNKLESFLKQKLNQRRLVTNKDVVYDVDKMVLTDIPGLIFVNDTFVLQRNDKRHSTVKSLTPTKKN